MDTIEQQQAERAAARQAAMRGLNDLLVALEADERAYCTLTCHGGGAAQHGIQHDLWGLDIVWGRDAILYRAEEVREMEDEDEYRCICCQQVVTHGEEICNYCADARAIDEEAEQVGTDV